MLKAGSTVRLFAAVLGGMLGCVLALWVFGSTSGLLRLVGLVMLAASAHGAILAFRLIDHTEPVLSMLPDGLKLSSVLSDKGWLRWGEITALQHVTLKALNVPADWFDYVLIRTTRTDAFTGWWRILPTARLGIFFLPTRMLEGGSTAGEQFVGDAERLRRDASGSRSRAIAQSATKVEAVAAPGLAQAPVQQQAKPLSMAASPAEQPAVRLSQRPAMTTTPQLAQRQDLGKAPMQPKPGYKGVLLNGKPLDY